jgi:pilus assembly protein CpaB
VDVLVAARAKGILSLSLRGVNDQAVVARPKPTPGPPAVDALEKRWKLEEEKRLRLEQELRDLKAMVAKKAAEPPPPPPPAPREPVLIPPPRYTTIYRGIDQVRRVRTDARGVEELFSRREATAGPVRFGAGPPEDGAPGDPDRPDL